MGEPIKIMDIARRMIRLAGLEPARDVKIDIVGLRPGEKLYEELFDEGDRQLPSVISGIKAAEPIPLPLVTLIDAFAELARSSASITSAQTLNLFPPLPVTRSPAPPDTAPAP